jgi:formate hydrogenlyase subunit 6/NADH:ubiquinone oxidoreductase subunit I
VRLRFEANDLDPFFEVIRSEGYAIIGPRVRDGAIVYDEVAAPKDLPVGWTDEQQPGRYRLKPAGSPACFGFASPPQSWKAWLFPPRERLFRATRNPQGRVQFTPEPAHPPKRAFLGVRPCDAHAIAIQDRVFVEGSLTDASYAAHRMNSLIVAVECTLSGETCFCASMRTGPQARGGFDLALTEVADGGRHFFLVHAGSDAGRRILDRLEQGGRCTPATAEEEQDAANRVEQAGRSQRRAIDPLAARTLLDAAFESPVWDDIAARCVNCANCTLVCPTCFCSTVEDTSDLTGNHAERWRRWDSCFTLEHSYLHGGSVRSSAKARYRQWLTHKLSSWWDQFGTSGCVGCGRCITWCPVGIDITEETERMSKP